MIEKTLMITKKIFNPIINNFIYFLNFIFIVSIFLLTLSNLSYFIYSIVALLTSSLFVNILIIKRKNQSIIKKEFLKIFSYIQTKKFDKFYFDKNIKSKSFIYIVSKNFKIEYCPKIFTKNKYFEFSGSHYFIITNLENKIFKKISIKKDNNNLLIKNKNNSDELKKVKFLFQTNKILKELTKNEFDISIFVNFKNQIIININREKIENRKKIKIKYLDDTKKRYYPSFISNKDEITSIENIVNTGFSFSQDIALSFLKD